LPFKCNLHRYSLRADLIATREKNGVYLSQSSFEQSEEERAHLRKRTEVGLLATL
jgi:hypothetical protein